MRRLRAAAPLTIRVPDARRPRDAPNLRDHARRFVLAFLALVALGATLLALPPTARNGEATPPVDALFTAVSAACVTGLVAVDTRDHWNGFGQAVILVLMQGGGLSFTVGTSVVLQMLRRGGSLRDALLLRDGEPALSVREAVELSGRILRFTLLVEAAGALAIFVHLWLGRDRPPLEAAWHGLFLSVAAFTNAGIDLSGGFRSLIPYATDVWLNVVIAALIQAGALSYLVFHDLGERRRWSRLTVDTRLVLATHALAVAAGALVFLGLEWGRALDGLPYWSRPMAATFQSVAARSGGFATVNFGEAGDGTLFAWLGLMLVGGAPGGTGGGVRLTTVAVVLVAIGATLRGHAEPQVFGRRLGTALVLRALTVIALFVAGHFAATLLLVISQNLGGREYRFIALMFEAMSALATDGQSTGLTPTLTDAGKLVLCATMFLGRVGPLTAVYAIQRRQRPPRYRFPEASVRIG